MSAQIEILALPFPVGRAFDEIIDVRSPSEYSEDHLTGAINLPVLSDEERATVGIRYQESHFEARKLGAALISRHIAAHLDAHFSDKPRNYLPLVYCWRGGQRSRSLATVLSEIGWRAAVLDGGYKAYRRHVLQVLETGVENLRLRIVNGHTGSGKTRMLEALRDCGAPVLNLEAIARHKGSVFGGEPNSPQPSQKRFESLIFDQLATFCACAPIYVEAESPKIGALDIPRFLWKRMRDSEVLEIDAPLSERIAFLLTDYQSWLATPECILTTIERLRPFHPRELIEQWRLWCVQREWYPLIESLLLRHYDTRYGVKGEGYYDPPEHRFEMAHLTAQSLSACAATIRGTEIESARPIAASLDSHSGIANSAKP